MSHLELGGMFDYMEPPQAFSEEMKHLVANRTEQLEKMSERWASHLTRLALQRFFARTDFVKSKTSISRRLGPGSATLFKGSRLATQAFTLTEEGRNVLLRIGQFRHDQEIYAGLVKPREAEHDAQVYRAYLKEWERIEKDGGTNPRVVLDFELKADIQKAIHARQKAEPDEELSAVKQKVAEQFDLKFIDDSIQIPDLRIEYDLDQGAQSGHSDVEVATAAYHGRHLAAKLQAGFRLYASASDRATLTARIEDDHDMMRGILDL
jgi:hypothetical protein